MKRIFFIFTLLSACSSVIAAEYPSLYRAPRPMSMGGAFTAVSDDVNALFYNPAGLNKIKKDEGEIVLFNPMGQFNSQALHIMKSVDDIAKGSNVMQTLNPYIGQNVHINAASMMPYWARHNFAVAFMFPNITSNTLLRRGIATQAYQTLIVDSGLMVGYSHGFLQDRLSIGTDVKVLVRGGGTFVFDAADLYKQRAINLKDMGGYGLGVDMDIGALYTFNKVWFFVPTVGVSFNNIFATQFKTQFENNSGVGLPPRLKRTMSLGSKFELPEFTLVKKWIVAVDIKNIGLAGSFFKKFHIGTEAWLLKFFGLRGGVNQGYITAGICFKVPVVRVDIFTYGEELGESVGTKEDRRFALQLSVGF